MRKNQTTRLSAARCLRLLLLFASATQASAQSVGIGTTTPNASAQLDISSSSRGILIPRMNTTTINAIANPAKGLMVYDSSQNQLLVNMGNPAAPDWETVVSRSGWNLNGNSGTDPANQFIGTTDNVNLNFRVNNSPAGSIDYTDYSTYVGLFAGSNASASTNTGFGAYALNVSTAAHNAAFGSNAMEKNTSGLQNTAVGSAALAMNTTSDNNCAVGCNSQLHTTTGGGNTSVGEGTMIFNNTGIDNTAVGIIALQQNTAGQYNTAIGAAALSFTTNSWYNTVVGANSAVNYDNGYNNVFLGANNDVNGDGYYNVIAIGQGVVCTASSQARIGNSATNSIGGYANWTNFSDGRYKKNMLENVKGLDFIMRLRPITYNLDVKGIRAQLGQKDPTDESTRRSLVDRESERLSGFAAQEVETAAVAAGYQFSGVDKPKNANDFYGLRYGDFVVPLVKAVQEQQQMIKALQEEVAELKKEIH